MDFYYVNAFMSMNTIQKDKVEPTKTTPPSAEK